MCRSVSLQREEALVVQHHSEQLRCSGIGLDDGEEIARERSKRARLAQ